MFVEKGKIMFLKIFFIALFSLSILQAKVFKNHEALYAISYGIIGEVGSGTVLFHVKENHYTLEIKTATQGLAKFLSKGRKDRMLSEGDIIDGRLVPRHFTKQVLTNYKSKTKRYTFYHDKREIWMQEEIVTKVKELSSMDIVMGRTKKDVDFRQKRAYKEEKVPFYAKDDLLTLFSNLKSYLGGFDALAPQRLYALGGDSKDGHITLYTPQSDRIQKELGGRWTYHRCSDKSAYIFQ